MAWFCLLVHTGQHQGFDGPENAEPILTQLFHGFWKIKVAAQGCLQQNCQRTRYFDMPRFGLSPSSSFIDQKNVCSDFQSKTDCLAFSGPPVPPPSSRLTAALPSSQAMRGPRMPKHSPREELPGAASRSKQLAELKRGHRFLEEHQDGQDE
jgi:hypothetical protein